MIAQIDTERAKLYRKCKQAREFSGEFFNGKVAQFSTKHGVGGVKMETSSVSAFYHLLHDRNFLELRVGEVDKITIPVIDMLESWKDAEVKQ